MAQALADVASGKRGNYTVDEGGIPVVGVGCKGERPGGAVCFRGGVLAEDGLQRVVIVDDGDLAIGIAALADLVAGTGHLDGEVLVAGEFACEVDYLDLDVLQGVGRTEADDGGVVVDDVIIHALLAVGNHQFGVLVELLAVHGLEGEGEIHAGGSLDGDVDHSCILIHGKAGRGEIHEGNLRIICFAAA